MSGNLHLKIFSMHDGRFWWVFFLSSLKKEKNVMGKRVRIYQVKFYQAPLLLLLSHLPPRCEQMSTL